MTEDHDRYLGMDRPITRRDFINGAAVVLGHGSCPWSNFPCQFILVNLHVSCKVFGVKMSRRNDPLRAVLRLLHSVWKDPACIGGRAVGNDPSKPLFPHSWNEGTSTLASESWAVRINHWLTLSSSPISSTTA